MQRWKRKWYSGGSRCTGLERTTAQKNISLAEAQGAFYILTIGFVLAFLVLITEKILHCMSWFKSAEAKISKPTAQKSRNQQDLATTYAVDVNHEGSNPVRSPIFGSSVEELFGYSQDELSQADFAFLDLVDAESIGFQCTFLIH